MGLLSKGFYGVIFFGEELWGGYILNCMLYRKPETSNKGSFFFKFLSKDHVSAGLKMKGFWINWKLDLLPQL